MAISNDFLGELGHHDFGDLISCLAPDVHHLVVALTGSHQSRGVLLGDFLHFGFSALNDALLLGWHEHVIDTNRDACLGRQPETVLQQLVCKDNGFFQAALAERDVDQFGDFLLLQCLVDVRERQTLGQDFRQECPTGRGFP